MNNPTRKPLSLFIAMMLVTIVLSLVTFWQYVNYVDDGKKINQEMALIKEISYRLKIDFLLQGNIWKNILLRGYDEQRYDAYVIEFGKGATTIAVDLQRLKNLTQDKNELNMIAKEFERSVLTMLARYMEVLPVYKLAEHDPHVTTDKYVEGINENAVMLIDKLQDDAMKVGQEKLNALSEQFSYLKVTILIISLLIMASIVSSLIVIRRQFFIR